MEKKEIADTLKEFREKVCGGTLFIGTLVALFSFLLGYKSVSKGFLLGTCFSIINFILLNASMPFSMGKDRKRATAVYFSSIMIRYVILAIPIIIAIKSIQFNLISTIIGIFSIQIVLFAYYVIIKRVLA